VLLTETVQLDPHRNPGWTRTDVEAELARTIGAVQAIWLPRGLTRDYDELGTRGHVDLVATFAAAGTVLLHSQRSPDHPDFAVSREAAAVLHDSVDATGSALELVELPAPQRLVDAHGPVDHSYVNHLVVNGGGDRLHVRRPTRRRGVGAAGARVPGSGGRRRRRAGAVRARRRHPLRDAAATGVPIDLPDVTARQHRLDTVAVAARTPDQPQPWAELGLQPDEYDRIHEILGRRPTAAELAMYSVMWSEHCSYKSSKVHLRKFGELPPETPVGKLLAGIGENAGVVDVGQGYAVTFKVESHNHPSYVEPYQGAATGVGGIVRDILAMGARPSRSWTRCASARSTPPTPPRAAGIVAGVGGYGNCLGLPNIGGEVVFDETYVGNPLVNALCVGVLRHEDLHLANATGDGNAVILYGARTGGDGIGGVSVLASETFDEGGPAKRPSVQVGDPFMEKLLIECTLELFAAGIVTGIQDLGGAGLSCATSELASAGDGGMHIDLDTVPLRDSSLSPEEILMSESQERMMAVVEPGDVDRFLAICAKWEVDATVIGSVTSGDRLLIDWHGETVVDVPPRTVAHEGPVYERPYARPTWQDALQADSASALQRPADLRATLLRMVASPNLADKSWVTDQYDRYVRGDTVLAQPDDAGVVRIDSESGLVWRCRPTAMAGSPSWTRTRGPGSPWRRRSATWPSPAHGRWQSPTASTSARRRTPR
jgi:hydrogenase maturation factor